MDSIQQLIHYLCQQLSKMPECDHQVEEFRHDLIINITRISHELEFNVTQEKIFDLLFEIDCTIQAVAYLDSIAPVSDKVYEELLAARKLTEDKCSNSLRLEQQRDGNRGRPSYVITKEQLECLVDLGFNATQMKDLLHVSKRTIERRLSEYGITSQPYMTIADDEFVGPFLK